MLSFLIVLAVILLLVGYFVVLPLSKKRPVLIRAGGLWFVYGITHDMLAEALTKATTMTRTPMQSDVVYTIDTNLRMHLRSLSSRTFFISFTGTASPKARLAKELFRKCIGNFFV